jgi:hypothetical protein
MYTAAFCRLGTSIRTSIFFLVAILVRQTGVAQSVPATGGRTMPPVIVIGFLGGFVKHDNFVHSEVQLAAGLRKAYPLGVDGHCWGGSEAIALARELKKDGIPVLLTVQVDSVSKIHQNDAVIPSNVAQAVNFYQSNGLVKGRRKIFAADAARTRIIGNFQFDYRESPLVCGQYPWYDRVFVKPHTQIECDPKVWTQAEALIRSN